MATTSGFELGYSARDHDDHLAVAEGLAAFPWVAVTDAEDRAPRIGRLIVEKRCRCSIVRRAERMAGLGYLPVRARRVRGIGV